MSDTRFGFSVGDHVEVIGGPSKALKGTVTNTDTPIVLGETKGGCVWVQLDHPVQRMLGPAAIFHTNLRKVQP